MSAEELSQIPDVPKGGPLEHYRKKATFNWKQVKLFFEDIEAIKFRDHIWQTLRKDPLFCQRIDEVSMDKQKEISAKRAKRLAEYAFNGLTREEVYEFPLKRILFDEATVMWDINASIKYSLHFEMFQVMLTNLGTERHQHFIKKCETLECYGCFALTEMSHGSNTREMKTTAHYDPKTEEFIINTPTFEDCKIWVGNLGKSATHAAVFAQLYTPDGVCHGLNIFIVPIRDPHTLYALPGITVGDMGAKGGLNGVDNGFLIFNNVRVARENLLNRTGDVTPDGRYITPFKDPNKRFGISLGALSNGRVGLTFYAHGFMSQALTIALRYAAVRKQFGPTHGQEIPILEYQTHQYRLLPALAVCFVWKNFSTTFFTNLVEFFVGLAARDTSDRQADFGREIHAISCCSKPVSSWTTQQVIQECREACGGHGYLKASKFSELRNNNDPLLTFEGDNNVLIQQTSNYLLSMYEEYLKNKKIETPLSSVDFINNFDNILKLKVDLKSSIELLDATRIMQLFDWLVCYLIKISYEKFNKQIKLGKDNFTARNDTQVYYLKTLSIAFMERLTIERYIKHLADNENSSLNGVLNRILYLASLHFLDKHMIIFYQGGLFTTCTPITLIREKIIQLCGEMKDDAIALVDAIAPPDYVLNSILGDSHGNVYKNLYSSMIQAPGCFERLSWYEEEVDRKPFGHLRSKL